MSWADRLYVLGGALLGGLCIVLTMGNTESHWLVQTVVFWTSR